MSGDHLAYLPLLVCIVVVAGLGFIMWAGNALLGPKRRNAVKGQPFECGGPPVDDPRRRFSVKFYLVGMIFLIFDIEAVLIIPWAVLYGDFLGDGAFGLFSLLSMLTFVGVLAVALVYVWRRGALDWD